MPWESPSRVFRRWPPALSSRFPGPKRTPVTILALAVTRAVTLLLGLNPIASSPAETGGDEDATEAASRINGPTILRVITQCARYG